MATTTVSITHEPTIPENQAGFSDTRPSSTQFHHHDPLNLHGQISEEVVASQPSPSERDSFATPLTERCDSPQPIQQSAGAERSRRPQVQRARTWNSQLSNTSSNRRVAELQNQAPEPGHLRRDNQRTFNSIISNPDSYEPIWVQQNVLCLGTTLKWFLLVSMCFAYHWVDGGGVRGYSTLLILNDLMRKIKEIEATHPDGPATCSSHPKVPPQPTESAPLNDNEDPSKTFYPCHYFDYMFGTSTGGLIAILLSRLRLSVQDALHIYENLARDIFGKPRLFSIRGPVPWPCAKHNHRRLEQAIKKVVSSCSPTTNRLTHQVGGGAFNFDPTFDSEASMCRTVCVSFLSHSVRRNSPFLFRSYEHAPPLTSSKTHSHGGAEVFEHNPGPAHALLIWKVARATSAAPSFFDPMEIDGEEFIDGGIGCNNPSSIAYFEVTQMHNNAADVISLCLSVGTGEPDFERGAGSKTTRLLKTLKALPKIVTNSAGVHQFMSSLKSTFNVPYYRLNVPEELGDLKMDTWVTNGKHSTKEKVTALTEKYLSNEEVQNQLREVAQKLVDRRRERARTHRWERVATGARYRCTFDKCYSGHCYRNTARELANHVRRRHFVTRTESNEAKVQDLVNKGKMH